MIVSTKFAAKCTFLPRNSPRMLCFGREINNSTAKFAIWPRNLPRNLPRNHTIHVIAVPRNFPLFYHDKHLPLDVTKELTWNVPQSHSSPSSTNPLPHTGAPYNTSGMLVRQWESSSTNSSDWRKAMLQSLNKVGGFEPMELLMIQLEESGGQAQPSSPVTMMKLELDELLMNYFKLMTLWSLEWSLISYSCCRTYLLVNGMDLYIPKNLTLYHGT